MREANVFCGGYQPSLDFVERERFLNRGVRRAVRNLCEKAHLPIAQDGMPRILSRKDVRRAKGVGIVEGSPIPRRVQRALVAGGMPVDRAKSLVWRSIW